MPEFDPLVTTHVITDANVLPTLRALGMKNLKNIPDHIPTLRWSWVLSVLGKETLLSQDEIEKKLGDTWLHAAFSQRMDAGYQPQKTVSLASLRDKTRILDKACRLLISTEFYLTSKQTHTPSLSTSSSSKAPPTCAPTERVQPMQDVGPSVVLGVSVEASRASPTIAPAETSTASKDDPLRRPHSDARVDDGVRSMRL